MTMASGDQDRSVSTPFGDHSHSIDTFGDDDFAPPPDSGPSAAQSSRRAKNAGINRPNTVGELDWYEDVSTFTALRTHDCHLR